MSVDLSFLYGDDNDNGNEEENKIKLPEGGGFISSLTAKWNIGPMYSMYTADSTGIDLDELEIPYDAKNEINGVGTFWYWRPSNYDNGVKAQKAAGARYAPGLIWRWEADLSTVKGWGGDQSPQEVFQNGLAFDVPIRSLSPSAARHELHMIMLPSMVQALAVTVGVIPEKIFDYEEFVREADRLGNERPSDTEGANKWDQDWATFAREWIGEDKAFEESKLWQARAAIWNALGESDPAAYTIDQGGSHDIESANLKALVRPLYKPQTSMWVKTARVSNPHASAAKKDKRRQIYVVIETYKNEEEAENASSAEDESGLKMPAEWASATPNDLVEFLADYLSSNKLNGKKLPIIKTALKKNGFEESASMTVDEAMVWIEAHGLAKE